MRSLLWIVLALPLTAVYGEDTHLYPTSPRDVANAPLHPEIPALPPLASDAPTNFERLMDCANPFHTAQDPDGIAMRLFQTTLCGREATACAPEVRALGDSLPSSNQTIVILSDTPATAALVCNFKPKERPPQNAAMPGTLEMGVSHPLFGSVTCSRDEKGTLVGALRTQPGDNSFAVIYRHTGSNSTSENILGFESTLMGRLGFGMEGPNGNPNAGKLSFTRPGFNTSCTYKPHDTTFLTEIGNATRVQASCTLHDRELSNVLFGLIHTRENGTKLSMALSGVRHDNSLIPGMRAAIQNARTECSIEGNAPSRGADNSILRVRLKKDF